MYKIPKSVRCNNKEKLYEKKKKHTLTHTKDNIYMIRQFAYVHKIVGISLFLWKNTECDNTVFSLKNDIKP